MTARTSLLTSVRAAVPAAPERDRTTPPGAPVAPAPRNPRALSARDVIALQRSAGNAAVTQLLATAAPRPNRTGLPEALKAGVEHLSGLAMDDVRVHYNSASPARVGALAYTQGRDIHLGPGQERHLPHEAWHVVQQMQGRVRPTLRIRDMVINDDASLEKEATELDGRVLSADRAAAPDPLRAGCENHQADVAQCVLSLEAKQRLRGLPPGKRRQELKGLSQDDRKDYEQWSSRQPHAWESAFNLFASPQPLVPPQTAQERQDLSGLLADLREQPFPQQTPTERLNDLLADLQGQPFPQQTPAKRLNDLLADLPEQPFPQQIPAERLNDLLADLQEQPPQQTLEEWQDLDDLLADL